MEEVRKHVRGTLMKLWCHGNAREIPEARKLIEDLSASIPTADEFEDEISFVEWFMCHAVNQWFSSPNVNSFWQVLTSSVPAAPTPELPVRPRGLLEVAKHFQINRSSSFVFENAVFRFALISTLLLHIRSFVESCAHRNENSKHRQPN